MKKKHFLFALTALLMLCLSVSVAQAATPEDMTHPQVAEKLDLLVSQLNNKYFITDRKSVCSNAAETCNVKRSGTLPKEVSRFCAFAVILPSRRGRRCRRRRRRGCRG